MVELCNVSFTYSQGTRDNGLSGISLTIPRGQVALLCGESGCGKTTLTRLINGLIPGYYERELTGSIWIDGKDITHMPMYETAHKVGSVFQNPRSQFFNVDTTSELVFGCENKGLPEEEIERRIAETVDDFGIGHLKGRSIFKLSGGEKQKIACASVSTCQPDIYVLDEPSSNLDVAAIQDLKRLIWLWKEQGKTVIIAEHRLYYLSELADRILYMKNGRIEGDFRMEQMRRLSSAELSRMGLRSLCLADITTGAAIGSDGGKCLSLSNFVFSYKYGGAALRVDSLQVPWGAVVAVIGHNGAGKSTFARCLCGLEKRCRGQVTVCGKPARHSDRLRRSYMVMQDVNHQLFTESVLDEVLLSMAVEDTAEAEAILDSLDLLPMKTLHPMSLSGGQKQRVAIASALASCRDIILFDEPTSGLDLTHMREVAQSILRLAEMGKMVFVISHDIELILACCNYVLHLERGRVKDHYPVGAGRERLLAFFRDHMRTG